ncbi:MAG TPA: helix-turn-helix domain-containing protein [Longimicrobiaceae bacterium]|nr:helix-turn-helix domain-containing protein [Longimicrobiaceae bacterium]
MTYSYEGVLVDVFDPGQPGADSSEVARSAAALGRVPAGARLTVSAPGVAPVTLPGRVGEVLGAILNEAARGHVVAVVSTAEEVSTGVAARLLGVSRPHVAKLVDAGVLPGRKISRHRRVRLADVMELKRTMERRHRLLDELIDESDSLDLYGRSPAR